MKGLQYTEKFGPHPNPSSARRVAFWMASEKSGLKTQKSLFAAQGRGTMG
jgi:hypothetical protein